MSIVAGPNQRAEIIQGFRALLDFLEAHPDIPIDKYSNRISVSVCAETDADERAEVDRIAAALGVTPTGDSHYTAVAEFGPVTYEATAILDEEMQQHEALMSYAGAVRPEKFGAAS